MALTFDTPRWKWVVTALDGSIPPGAGEIYGPNQRTYSDQLNGMRTASCSVPIDHPRLAWLLNNDALMKVYRRSDKTGTWKLKMVGDVVQTEEQGQGGIGNVVITAADGFWRLATRLIGMNLDPNTGQGVGFTVGTATAPLDLSIAIQSVLAEVNEGFYSGVNITASYGLCGTTSVVGPLYAVFAGSTMQQIANTLGGPDFWVDPYEPLGSGAMPTTTIGVLNIAAYRGQFQPNAIFDYGCGKFNVQNYTRLLTKQSALNHAVALPQGWPNAIAAGDKPAIYDDTVSQNTISRFDDIVSSDVANYNLREILAQEAVSVRKHKQQQIVFTPSVDCDVEYSEDYDVGDVVLARAYDASSKTYRYNGSIRIYGVNVQVDDNDAESTNLTLIPDQVSNSTQITGTL